MKSKTFFTLLTILAILTSCLDSNQVEKDDTVSRKYRLTGKVLDKQVDTVILYKPNEDPHFQNIKIPVVNGEFNYDFKVDVPIGYDLMDWKAGNPGGRYLTVFLEQNDINLKIFPEDEWDMNEVVGGKVNSDYKSFLKKRSEKFTNRINPLGDKLNKLFKEGDYYSEEMKQLRADRSKASGKELVIINNKIDSLRQAKLNLSQPARILEDKITEIYNEQKVWEENYIKKNTDAISYYLFLTQLSYNPETVDLKTSKEQFNEFKNKFPNHPYNEITALKISSLSNLKVGQKFIDFSAPDLDGNLVKLSNKIKGKKAILNLWATWCGPCIIKSRELVPVFENYKHENFTVIGVAGEFNNTKKLEKFLEKEQYPWLNLVEIDGKNSIWEKYGVSRSGGGLFLINEDGIIVAIGPSVNEIEEFLKENI